MLNLHDTNDKENENKNIPDNTHADQIQEQIDQLIEHLAKILSRPTLKFKGIRVEIN